jgi:hypothetical protein
MTPTATAMMMHVTMMPEIDTHRDALPRRRAPIRSLYFVLSATTEITTNERYRKTKE